MSWKSKLIVVALLFGFVAYVIYSSLAVRRFRCEACVEYQGQSACRSAVGMTREEASRTAVDNACAQLVSGVTDTIACTQKEPVSVRCEEL